MRAEQGADRVGIGWRGELAASIFENIESIDVLEVIAEDWLDATRDQSAALEDLARTRPLLLHGVSLGLASCEPIETRRIDRIARLVSRTRPEAWSEHLAFVRAGGTEIGHLAAPPRTEANVAGALKNLERTRRTVGMLPCLENVATLIDPPGSSMDEPQWTRAIVNPGRASMLLDLHNLYANAVNFGRSPLELLHAMPLASVSIVHLSGGRWMDRPGLRPRLLDDHLHDVPEEVYTMLEALACAVEQPLTVILERDGNFPGFEALLAQVGNARRALALGRAARVRATRAAA